MYCGKCTSLPGEPTSKKGEPPTKGGGKVVKAIVRDRNHVVVMHNFFTSIEMFEYLHEKGT